MYQKLNEEAIDSLLETGIAEFAKHGFNGANINMIAKEAHISVGAIYKYYDDKPHFFLACVRHSLKLLEAAMEDVLSNEADVMTCIQLLVRDLMDAAAKHPNYYVMYNEITSGSCRQYAAQLAHEIEEKTAAVYYELMRKAQLEGKVRADGNPRMFAFLFDNLLMTLQFSFSCDYYRERMKIFCGADTFAKPEELEKEFTAFMANALGIRN